MKSTIEEIFFGKRGNYEKIELGEEYWRLVSDNSELCKAFEKSLTDNQKKQFNEIIENSGGMEAEAARAHYTEGFKIGLLVAVESFTK